MSEPKKIETQREKQDMIKIDSLEKLKQELKISTLDTSKDAILEAKKLNFEISRKELDDLTAVLLGIPGDTEKLERLKKIIDEKEAIKAKTGKETDKLKSELEILPISPEGMQKAFEYIETNGIKDAHRYLLISTILNKFIYANKLEIKNDGFFVSKFEVIDNEGKPKKEYSEILDKFLLKDDFEQTKIFQISLREGGIQKKVNNIASKYGISLKYSNEEEKSQLKTQINTSEMKDEEKSLIIKYLDGGYKKTDKLANEYFQTTEENIKKSKKELQNSTGIEFTQEKMADYARNPEKLIGDVFTNLSKSPILLFSTFGLILGKIFGFNITGDKSNFLMKLFATGAGFGLYKTLGVGDMVGDAIEGKVHPSIKTGVENAGVAMTWAWGKIKNLPQKASATGKELAERVSFWYKFSNFEYTDIKGNKADLIDSNFEELYSKTKSGYGNSLSRSDGKQIEQKDLTSLTAKLNKLHNDGIKKYKNEQAFFTTIKGMNITQVIDNVTDEKPKEATPKTPSSAPSGTPTVAPNIPQSRIPGVGQAPVTAPQNTPSQTPKISRIPDIK